MNTRDLVLRAVQVEDSQECVDFFEDHDWCSAQWFGGAVEVSLHDDPMTTARAGDWVVLVPDAPPVWMSTIYGIEER